MWGFASNAIALFQMKKEPRLHEPLAECSDDDIFSYASEEEGLECPICWEFFNIVENVPYVLWCGHTLCENCVFGLDSILCKLPMQQQIKVPFFILCPWCHLLSFRLVYQGRLKFPRKNFFLLWMVERLNGDRLKISSSSCEEGQPFVDQVSSNILRTISYTPRSSLLSFHSDHGTNNVGRSYFSLHESLEMVSHFTSKFPLIIVFLLILFLAVPVSAAILFFYLLVTVVVAIPSFLVLYFAYPILSCLVREIIS